MNYQSNKPYPQPMVTSQNEYYAKLLLEDYAGAISETSAVMLYSHQHFTTDKIYPEYADLIHHISIVEMHHLELLGETILLLGNPARFESYQKETNSNIPWTSSNLNYANDMKTMLEADISGETQAITQYRQHIEKINDPYIQQLLFRIIEDEIIHLNLFQNLYQKIRQ